MAKIGTAHIELKPVLDEEALALIAKRIEEAVRAGVAAGLRDANPPTELKPYISGEWTARTQNCPCRRENGGSGVCGCILGGPKVTC